VHNVTIDTDAADSYEGPPLMLGENSRVTLDATYIVTADDVAAGEIVRSATVRGEASTGVEARPRSKTLTHRVVQQPSIELDVTGEHRAPSDDEPLGSIAITFAVTNTGDSTLTGSRIFAALLGDAYLPVGTLGPGDDATVTASYALSQRDIDAGSVLIEASASGMPPGDGAGVNDWAKTLVAIPHNPALALAMRVTAVTTAGGDYRAIDPAAQVAGLQAGDVVTFSLIATNSGDVTLPNVDLTAPLLADLSCDEGNSPGPADEVDCTGTYTITRADVSAGIVDIEASATANAPDGTSVTATAHVSIELTRKTGLDIVILADRFQLRLGSIFSFTLKVTNTGTTPLIGVTIDIPGLGISWGNTARGGVMGKIAPGVTRTATARYTVTEADVSRGGVALHAIATGDGHEGETSAHAKPVRLTIEQPAPDPTQTPGTDPDVTPTPDPDAIQTPGPTQTPGTTPPAEATPGTSPMPDATSIPSASSQSTSADDNAGHTEVLGLPRTGSGAGEGSVTIPAILLIAATVLVGGAGLVRRQRLIGSRRSPGSR